MIAVQLQLIKLFPFNENNFQQVEQQVNDYVIKHYRGYGNYVDITTTQTYICVKGPQPVSLHQHKPLSQIIETQAQLIEVLEGQINDLVMMSKIELGDDVIARIVELRKELSL